MYVGGRMYHVGEHGVQGEVDAGDAHVVGEVVVLRAQRYHELLPHVHLSFEWKEKLN